METVIKVTKYLNFTDISSNYPDRTTKTIGVGNNSGEKLGYIMWRSSWRRYIFSPLEDTIFDTSCLNDIVEVISKLMEERK
jgi:hypothetical protein